MGYQIYKNVNGQLVRLVYPVSGNSSLQFNSKEEAIVHLNDLVSRAKFFRSNAQYAVLNSEKKIVYVTPSDYYNV